MLFFGHLGLGQTIVRPWSRDLPTRWLLLGTILPDLIDKPLYYGLVVITGRWGAEIGLISGTRTFGHSALVLFALTALCVRRGGRRAVALGLGMLTHILLDSFMDGWYLFANPGVIEAFLFPLFGWRFPTVHSDSTGEYIKAAFTHGPLLTFEVIGASLLFLFWRKDRNSKRSPLHRRAGRGAQARTPRKPGLKRAGGQ